MMRSPQTSSLFSQTRKSMLLRCYYASMTAALGTTLASSAVSSSSPLTPTAVAFITSSSPPPSSCCKTTPSSVFSVTSSSAYRPSSVGTISSAPFTPPLNLRTHPYHYHHYQQQRGLFFSRNSNNNKNKSLFQKAATKVKSLLKIQTPEEKKASIEKKRRKEQITGSLSTLLKDAPLPVKLVGKMMGPLLSNMAESFAEQSNQVSELLQNAEFTLQNSDLVKEVLGNDELIRVGMPYSQSSSTTVVNGVQTSNIQVSFPVRGSLGQGTATVQGSGEYGISYLGLNVNGRSYNVPLDGGSGGSGQTEVFGGSSSSSSRSSKKSSGGGGKFREEDVIDVEFVEKKKTE